MGCTSSSHVDPVTGGKKNKLGGAYPGNRRPQQAPYAPPHSNFQKVDGNTAQATAHFVAYGGGNALVLVDQANAPPQLATGVPQKEFIQVTLPDGVNPGDTIHVQAPDGRLNAIVVPAGMYAGSTFTVEFAGGPPPPSSVPAPKASAPAATNGNGGFASGFDNSQPTPYVPTVATPTVTDPGGDDGFATGFNNPHAVTAVPAEPDINFGSSYPSAPAYPAPPSYPTANAKYSS